MNYRKHRSQNRADRRRYDAIQTVSPRAVQQAYQRLARWIYAPGLSLRHQLRRSNQRT